MTPLNLLDDIGNILLCIIEKVYKKHFGLVLLNRTLTIVLNFTVACKEKSTNKLTV